MPTEDDREKLAQTFDTASELYQRARPGYPDELFEDLVDVTGLAPRDRLLEVGCATGKATLPLARRGFRITCIEPGAALGAAARRNLAGFDVDVIEGRFEDWSPRLGESFDLVFAATAWHWVDPAVRYRKAWEALRPAAISPSGVRDMSSRKKAIPSSATSKRCMTRSAKDSSR
jgi:SAM-dependent methyltransferase